MFPFAILRKRKADSVDGVSKKQKKEEEEEKKQLEMKLKVGVIYFFKHVKVYSSSCLEVFRLPACFYSFLALLSFCSFTGAEPADLGN